MEKLSRLAAVAGALALGPGFAAAQDAGRPMPRPQFIEEATPAERAADQVRLTRWRETPPPASGPYGSVREEIASLPGHTVFRPARLAAVRGKLPIVAWGNGGCSNTPIRFTAFLGEIASRGYLVVAAGTIDVDFQADAGAVSSNGKPRQVVARSVLTDGVDWAIRQNGQRGSPFAGRLATNRIAYMGHSCGGMQALSASVDPRTTTTIALNSGRFPKRDFPPYPEWFEWNELHAPIALFSGGPKDNPIAHRTYPQIDALPVFLADLPVGHTSAYIAPDMRWTKAVTGWLDWKLKDDRKAGALFLGPSCGLCRDADWTVTGWKNLAPRQTSARR